MRIPLPHSTCSLLLVQLIYVINLVVDCIVSIVQVAHMQTNPKDTQWEWY